MSSEIYRETWNDEIDLRRVFAVLLRRKALIISLIVMAVGVAAFFSFFILPPVYEADVVLQLPRVENGTITGLTHEALLAMALSPDVLERVSARLHDGLPVDALRHAYQVKLDANARLLHASAQAGTAAEAHQRVDLWTEAFRASVTNHLEQLVNERIVAAGNNLAQKQEQFNSTKATLSRFEAENTLDLSTARLRRLEAELVLSEARFAELTLFAIPGDEGRLEFLRAELAEQSRSWDAEEGGTGISYEVSQIGNGNPLLVGSVINPVYLHLSQEISITAERLVANKGHVMALETFIQNIKAELATLRQQIASLQAERDALTRELSVANVLFGQAEDEYHMWLDEARGIEAQRPIVVSASMIPVSPVGPRKVLNIALAAFLAAFVGVGIAFLMEIWDSGDRTTRPTTAV